MILWYQSILYIIWHWWVTTIGYLYYVTWFRVSILYLITDSVSGNYLWNNLVSDKISAEWNDGIEPRGWVSLLRRKWKESFQSIRMIELSQRASGMGLTYRICSPYASSDACTFFNLSSLYIFCISNHLYCSASFYICFLTAIKINGELYIAQVVTFSTRADAGID
jgi:hypothetical protein